MAPPPKSLRFVSRHTHAYTDLAGEVLVCQNTWSRLKPVLSIYISQIKTIIVVSKREILWKNQSENISHGAMDAVSYI